MIALINGIEGGALKLFKGAATLLRLVVLSDGDNGPSGQVPATGTPLDVTGDTVSLLIYDTADRRNAALATVAGTIVTAAAGYLTISVLNATIAIGPGTFFGFISRSENTGTTLEFSRNMNVITIG